MSLTSSVKLVSWWRMFTLVLSLAVTLSLYGCGGSDAATQEEGEETEEPAAKEPEGQKIGQDAPAQQQPAQQTGLTNFNANQTAAPANQPLAAYEKQMEDLRTENTTLKQKVMKLEADNRSVNTRVTDLESQLATEKARADKAEEALKAAPAQAATPAPAPVDTTKAAPAAAPVNVASNYDDALKMFNAKKYDDAIASFQAMLDGGAKEDVADNCKYWIGESQFGKAKYSDAIKSFQAVMKYKNSEKKGDAQYMIAQCYEKLGNKAKAKEGYEKVVKDYPMNSHIKRSKERWAKL